MLKIILGIIGLGIIVFVHELGHFLMARLCGVDVEAFSIGMGPILFRKKIGLTEYRISLIPLGGYCSMKGERAFSEAIEQNLPSIPKEPRSFYGVHCLKRALIAFFGPAFNIVFTWIAFLVIALVGYTQYTTSNRIILLTDKDATARSVAADAGLLTGDYIISIDGEATDNFSQIYEKVGMNPQKDLAVKVNRNGDILDFTLTPLLDKDTGAGKIGVYSWTDTKIVEVTKGSPGDIAGLQSGDVITKVNGIPVANTVDFSFAVYKENEFELTYLRNGIENTANVFIPYDNGKLRPLGIVFEFIKVESPKLNLFSAAKCSLADTFSLAKQTFSGLALLFKGIDLTKAVSGPIRITSMLGEVAQSSFSVGFKEGVVSCLNFLAIISISLCIMNLLPIPVLDGGIILFAIWEFLFKKQIPPKVLSGIQLIGVSILIFLMIFATFGDIKFLAGK
jgi:regulator of sigma E protease